MSGKTRSPNLIVIKVNSHASGFTFIFATAIFAMYAYSDPPVNSSMAVEHHVSCIRGNTVHENSNTLSQEPLF